MQRVLVALSGGVDSSVCAYLLKQRGYEVFGVSFLLYDLVNPNHFERARQTALMLNLSHEVLDIREEFKSKVIEPFFEAYRSGITPNPCVWCNPHIKFDFLLREADRRSIDFVSTGHYARVSNGGLYKAKDLKKDQSYALYRLSVKQLMRIVLPLGDYLKPQTREIAKSLSLPTADTPESQEICFLQGSSYYNAMKKTTEGLILHKETGKRLGTHRGFHHFTIGQRKRLGLSNPEPLYVVDIDPASNTVFVGDRSMAMSDSVKVRELNWLVERDGDFEATVKIRSTMKDEPAIVKIIAKDEVLVRFHEPQWAPAPGQSAVFYEGERVIGGGIITK